MRTAFSQPIALLTCAILASGTYVAYGETSDPSNVVLSAARRVCSEGVAAAPVPQAELLSERSVQGRGAQGLKRIWRLGDKVELRVTRLNRIGGRGALFFVDYYQITPEASYALIRAVVNDRCQVLGGRKVTYGPTDDKPNAALSIAPLDSDLKEKGKSLPLNPEIPPGEAPANCVRVALLDNGVNYLLPEIASLLARDPEGQIVGYDYWEEDRRPFDYGVPPTDDPRISMFSPRRHGTAVASVFVREVTSASGCLAAYRYQPSDDDNKIGRIISDMAKDGVRVVSVSSGRPKPWPDFQSAMKAHPNMLFVLSAGNNGVDLSRRPFYPAAYDADNAIVVAASNDAGKLWEHSNRGLGVDIAINAVNVPGFDFTGRERLLTGTSFASPRVAALAARVLADNPEWSAAQVKSRIIALAHDSKVQAEGIPVLTDDVLNRAFR